MLGSMEKIHHKSNLKVKTTSTLSALSSWSSTATRGMRKQEGKERAIEKSKTSPKASSKETKKPQEFKLHSEERAMKRAMFNYFVATKIYVLEHEKRQLEKLQKMIEEEEVKSLRKKMVPRAQLMPFFDRPFFPQRSNRRLTMPREPSFKMVNSKCMSCVSENGMSHFQQPHHQTYY